MFRVLQRTSARSFARFAVAGGAASYATYSLHQSAKLEGTFDSIKEKAGELKDKVASKSPLKPESPAGIPGAKTSHNPSTNMNHGQGGTSAASDAQQPDPLVAAQKKRQKASGNETNNDDKQQNAKKGGGTGAKIASGHSKNDDGKRVPNHDDIKPDGKSTSSSSSSSKKSSSGTSSSNAAAGAGAVAAGLGQAEKDAEKQEAFNEETGEINWECPCLGGMASGPCGDDFKDAFSCFVYSKPQGDEPKGAECLEKFRAMQDCFKQHPEIYGNLAEDPGEKIIE